MHRDHDVVMRASSSILETNRVLRNTYILLSLSLLLSAGTAGFAMVTNAPMLHPLLVLAGYFGLLMLLQVFANSGLGILLVFAFTGFLGYTLGPTLNMYLHVYANGEQIIMTALGGTGIIFFGLSGYAMSTQKDFSYLTGFLFVGFIAILMGTIANLFLAIPALDLVLSFVVIMIFSGFILLETSMIIHGGQRNYILATVQLYLSILNIFMHLLHILSMFAGNRE